MTEEAESDQANFGGEIETARLVLRPLRAPDRAALADLSGADDIMQALAAMPGPVPGPAGETFAAIAKRSAEIVGAAALGPMFEQPALTGIAVWIGEPYRRLGYATEAAHAVIDRAFADATVAVLWCCNRVTNMPARRVIEKCGFQFRETGMARSPAAQGAVPVERFALDRRNWLALRTWGRLAPRNDRNGQTHDTAA